MVDGCGRDEEVSPQKKTDQVRQYACIVVEARFNIPCMYEIRQRV